MTEKMLNNKANCETCDTDMWPIYETSDSPPTPECVVCGSTDLLLI